MKYLISLIVFILAFGKVQAASVVLFDSKDIRVEANSFGYKNLWICFELLKLPNEYELQEGSLTYTKLDDFRWGNPNFIEKKIDSINVIVNRQ
jgi:hypothetical protein